MEMKNTQDLAGREAITKLQQLVKGQNTCLFGTRLTRHPVNVRPMATLEVDDEGAFWFLSSAASEKNRDIMENAHVQLFFCDPDRSEFLTVYGTCGIVTDLGRIKEHWTSLAKAWFPGGANDPDVTLLRVAPEEAHYWDTKNGKAITFLKIVAAAMTGSATDGDGVQGDLQVQSK
jgi:general stress protein 26